MWVKNPGQVKRAFERHGEDFRLRFMRYALFAGCLTGRRLLSAFGEDLCDQIIWEETTREIAGDAKTIFPPDLQHMRAVIDKHQPALVISFGKIAAEAVPQIWSGPKIICPHPAARQVDTFPRLQRAAAEMRVFLNELTPIA
jgi:hypothetical protein